MRPVTDAAHQAVLDRIDVAVFDMAAEIVLVADQMFPKPALPDAAFAARRPGRRAPDLPIGPLVPLVRRTLSAAQVAVCSASGVLPMLHLPSR